MERRAQNIAVGLTVIVALLILAGLTVAFTGLPQLFQRGYEIEMLFERTGDTRTGDVVYMAGMSVGRITDVRFTDPNDVTKGVTLTARIDPDVRLPGDVKAEMFTRGVAGTPYLQLAPGGPARIDPRTGQRMKYIPTDRVVMIPGYHKPSGLVPQEVTDAVKSLSTFASKADKLIDDIGPAIKSFGKLADNLNDLFAEEPAAPAPDGSPEATRPTEAKPAPARPTGLKATLAKLSKLIDGLNTVVGDPENQKNLKVSLANLASASAQAKETLKSLRDFSEEARRAAGELSDKTGDLVQKLIHNAEQLSAILTSFEKAAINIEQGKGSIGKLVYDNELYESLLEAAKTLAKTLEELQGLLKEWKASGVGIKLK